MFRGRSGNRGQWRSRNFYSANSTLVALGPAATSTEHRGLSGLLQCASAQLAVTLVQTSGTST